MRWSFSGSEFSIFRRTSQRKGDEFENDEGWGQCLAAMLASQTLNEDKPLPIYGIVPTGLFWEFSKLHEKRFTRYPSGYSLSDPARVQGILEEVFIECE